MNDRNKKAWEQIKKEGLSIDVQIYGDESHLGFVDKDRNFHRFFAKKKFNNIFEAQRDSRAVARAISKETGIPLHPNVPSERLKQVPSYTKNQAHLKLEWDMGQRELEREWEESPQGQLYFWLVAIIVIILCAGGWILAIWIMSLLQK